MSWPRGPRRRCLSPREMWAKAALQAARDGIVAILDRDLGACGLPAPEREVEFDPVRHWRFDRAWRSLMVGVEVDGLTRQGGRHQTIDGFERDAEKLNAAAAAGWRVFRFTRRQVERGHAVRLLEDVLRRAQAVGPGGSESCSR